MLHVHDFCIFLQNYNEMPGMHVTMVKEILQYKYAHVCMCSKTC